MKNTFATKVIVISSMCFAAFFALYVAFSTFAPTIAQADEWGDWNTAGEDFSLGGWGDTNTASDDSWGGWNTASDSSWDSGWNTASDTSWATDNSSSDNTWGDWNTATDNTWDNNWNTASDDAWGDTNTASNDAWDNNWNTASDDMWGNNNVADDNTWGDWNTATDNTWDNNWNTASDDAWGTTNTASDNAWGDTNTASDNAWGNTNTASDNAWGTTNTASDNAWGDTNTASDNAWGNTNTASDSSYLGREYANNDREYLGREYANNDREYLGREYAPTSVLGSGLTFPNPTPQNWGNSQGLFAQTSGYGRASTPSNGGRSSSGGGQVAGASYSAPRQQMASASGPSYQTPSYYPAPQPRPAPQPQYPSYPAPQPQPVQPQPTLQPTCQMSVSQSQISLGETATLYWSSANANQAAIAGMGNVQLSGSREIRPAVGSHTYTLNVRSTTGRGLQSACTATITVVEEQPACSITVNPSSIQRGQGAVLSWTTQNATTAGIMGIGPVSLNGSRSVYPQATTTYTMRVLTRSGKSETCTATVNVVNEPIVAGAIRCAIYADKQNIQRGETVTLSWAVQGATTANLSGFGQVPLVGTRTVAPQSNATYVLGASTGNGQREDCSVAVNVNNPVVLGASTSRFQYPEVIDEPEPMIQRIVRNITPQTVYRYMYPETQVVQEVPQQVVVQQVPQRVVVQEVPQRVVVQPVVQPIVVRQQPVVQPIVRIQPVQGVVAGATIAKPTVKIASAIELPLEKVSLAANTTPETGFEDMILPFFLVALMLSAIYGTRAMKNAVRVSY